ncbi:MAG TPA: sigma 54-interacting transcriptional regulator [Candidatus Bilamarchaeaceae archaeon]|nr:sigma 54-interacting transcriptional regulator [Candidatus Bilamarchaeaceae archaeon]
MAEERVVRLNARTKNGKTEPLRKMMDRFKGHPERVPEVKEVLDCIVGASHATERMKKDIYIAAPLSFPVLITGDTGTGKELVAMALHLLSPRYAEPFEAVNCAAIPEGLAESILFGHKRGSFTGAASDQPGVFEVANGGTLFLDEIGDLPLHTQVKVLRALEEGLIRMVGSREPISIHMRVIAATNHDVDQAAEEGKLRRELLYRLVGYRVRAPALNERKQDIPLLADYFLADFNRREKQNIAAEEEAWEFLQDVNFPGNIRQLRALIECAAAVGIAVSSPVSRDTIMEAIGILGTGIRLDPETESTDGMSLEALVARGELRLEVFERALILEALRRTGGSTAEAARLAGISARNIQYRKVGWLKGGVPLPEIRGLNVVIRETGKEKPDENAPDARERLGLPMNAGEWTREHLEKAMDELPPFSINTIGLLMTARVIARAYGVDAVEVTRRFKAWDINIGYIRERVRARRKALLIETLRQSRTKAEACRKLRMLDAALSNHCTKLGILPREHLGKGLGAVVEPASAE